MLETSKDIFWIGLIFAIVWLTLFISWGMFYMIMIMRDMRKITGGIKRKFQTVEKILEAFKCKAENSASYIPVAISAIEKIADHMGKKKKPAKKKARTKKK